MACTYVKEFKFAEGGHADLRKDKAMVKTAVHKHEKAMHKGEPVTKLKKGGAMHRMPDGSMMAGEKHGMKKGGKFLEKSSGEQYAAKSAMMKHEKTETPRMEREEMVQKRMVRGPAMAAGRDPRIPLLKCGGKVKK